MSKNADGIKNNSVSYLSEGNRALREKKYDKAIALYKKAVTKSPSLKEMIIFNLTHALKNKKIDFDLFDQKKTEDKTYNYEGRLESFKNFTLRGWAVEKENPKKILKLEVRVDGILFCMVNAEKPRNDLKRLNKSSGKGGYEVCLPSCLFTKDKQVLEVLYPDGTVLGSIEAEGEQSSTKEDMNFFPFPDSISIIVPIFNALEDVCVCIDRIIKYTDKSVEVILIDDASTDPRVYEYLCKANLPKNFRIYQNKVNLGFTKTVNKGIEIAQENDVVLLNSDARVTPRWLDGFKRALSTDIKIATVTAMSDRAGAFSAPNIGNENQLPDNVSEENYSIAFRRRGKGFYPTVPTGNGFCMFIRRACINEIGNLDEEAFPRGYGEENDFCMRARSKGWRNVIDDRTYVFHDRSKSFGTEKNLLITQGRSIIDSRYPDYKKAIEVYSNSPLINMARYQARKALEDCKAGILPRGLFVISTLTGGTPQTNKDLMLALSGRVECWLLHCDSKVLSLYMIGEAGIQILIRKHILTELVDPLTHKSAEYDRVVNNWLRIYDFEFVHIRHLSWHSLTLPKIAKENGCRTLLSFHDYYVLCPTVKLIDGNNFYCGGVCTKNNGVPCKPELWDDASLPELKNKWVYKWRDIFSGVFQYCDFFITTHESVKETVLEYFDISKDDFFVIPHGRDFDDFYDLSITYNKEGAFNILIPGNVSAPKGSEIIKEILERDSTGLINFHILGKSNINFKHPRLIMHGSYQRDEFSKHVLPTKAHIGAVFSIWNETWCHTLTELWSVGIPVLSLNFLTVAERIKRTSNGWVSTENNIDSVLEKIYELMKNPSEIDLKRKNVISWQTNVAVKESTNVMADRYYELYTSINSGK